MMQLILAAVLGYLLGSVSVAILMTKLVLHRDVREQGSGNAGATNVARVFGMKAGVITLLGDVVKTVVSGAVGYLLAGDTGLAISCAACMVGHCWPVFFHFKGGKGIAVGAGVALLLDWRILIALLVIFAVMFVLTKRVSPCSVTCAFFYPFLYYFLYPGFTLNFWLCVLMAVLVVYMHRDNIKRLIRGEEPKFKPKQNH